MATTATPEVKSAKVSTEKFDIAYGYQTATNKDGSVKQDEKGAIVREAVVLSPEKAEELSDKNLFEGSVISVSTDYPATFDALVELANTPAKDEDGSPREQKDIQNEIVKLFVNGAKAKVMNRLRALLTKTDENGNLTFKEPADGEALDLTNEITSGSKRVFLTEEQKMWKGLQFLPQTQKENVWRAYLTGIGKEYYVPEE